MRLLSSLQDFSVQKLPALHCVSIQKIMCCRVLSARMSIHIQMSVSFFSEVFLEVCSQSCATSYLVEALQVEHFCGALHLLAKLLPFHGGAALAFCPGRKAHQTCSLLRLAKLSSMLSDITPSQLRSPNLPWGGGAEGQYAWQISIC